MLAILNFLYGYFICCRCHILHSCKCLQSQPKLQLKPWEMPKKKAGRGREADGQEQRGRHQPDALALRPAKGQHARDKEEDGAPDAVVKREGAVVDNAASDEDDQCDDSTDELDDAKYCCCSLEGVSDPCLLPGLLNNLVGSTVLFHI